MAAAVVDRGPQSALPGNGHGQTVLLHQSPDPKEPPLFQFPNYLRSKLCWTHGSFPEPAEYVVLLTTDDTHCVEAAISSFKCQDHNFNSQHKLSANLVHSQEYCTILNLSREFSLGPTHGSDSASGERRSPPWSGIRSDPRLAS
jgi:hypothetical protein